MGFGGSSTSSPISGFSIFCSHSSSRSVFRSAVAGGWQRFRLPIIINLILIVPLYFGGSTSGERAASFLLWNVNYHNGRTAELVAQIAEIDADVVAVQELTPPLSKAIAAFFPNHTWLATPREDAFGIGILTKLPIRSETIHWLGQVSLPAQEVVLETEAGPVSILTVHTTPPIGREYAVNRDQMIADIGQWVRGVSGPVVVLGDLNATAWSAPFRKLLNETRLLNSQRGFGLQVTWPRELVPLSISIDHLLHSEQLATSVRRTGAFVGSDHRSLYVELAVAKR